MSTEPMEGTFESIASAIAAVPGLELRQVSESRWERRSAQVWYSVQAHGVADIASQVVIEVGLVIPLIDRMLDSAEQTVSVGGNLLRLAGRDATNFDLQPVSRRGKLVARLRAPVLGVPDAFSVTEGEPFTHEVSALLTSAFMPLVELTSWEQVANLLATQGSELAARGLCPPDVLAREGILRWAAGDRVQGSALVRQGLEPAAAERVEARLHERFGVSATS